MGILRGVFQAVDSEIPAADPPLVTVTAFCSLPLHPQSATPHLCRVVQSLIIRAAIF